MIRALAHKSDGRPIVLLGLQAENLDRLREGQPIQVNLQNLGEGQVTDLPDIDVVIFFANEEATQKLKANYLEGLSIREENEA